MGKYDPLRQRLAHSRGRMELTFDEIDSLVGALPASARSYREWWANSRSNPQARAWLELGREVEHVNLNAGRVRFSPPRAQPPQAEPEGRLAAAAQNTGGPLGPVVDAAQVEVGLVWRTIGFVTLDGRGKPAFPHLPSDPAVYRLVLDGPSGPSLYIGETDNLRRRCGNYRNPGPSQQTSMRIGELLRRDLQLGCAIRLDIAEVRLTVGGNPLEVDLASKAVRILVEHAALAAAAAAGTETHNL